MKVKFKFIPIMLFYFTNSVYSQNLISDTKSSFDQASPPSEASSITTLRDSLKDLKYRSPDRAIKFAMEVLQRKKYNSGKYPKTLSAVYNNLGEVYLRMNLPSQALTYFIESKILMGDRPAPWLSVQFGNVYFNQGEWIKAKEQYLIAIGLFDVVQKKIGYKKKAYSIEGKTVCLSNLGRIEIQLNNFDNALSYFQKGLELKKTDPYFKAPEDYKKLKNGKHHGIANAHYLLADLYYKWEMEDLAKIQLFKVDSLLLPIYDMIMQKTELKIKPAGFPDISRVLGLSNTLKSKIFMNNKKFDQSKDAAIFSNILLKNWPIYNVRNHASFASIYFSQDSLYLALGEIDKGLRICKLKGLSVEELQLLELKMDFFERSNLSKSAVNVASEIIKKRKIIDGLKMSGLLESVEYKTELYQSKNKLMQAQKQQRALQIIIGGLFIFFGVIILHFRNKKRNSEQISIISQQENKITQVELKNKEAELINLSTFELSKNDLLNNVKRDLEYHSSLIRDKSDQKTLKPLKKKIQNYIDDGIQWEDYKRQFSTVYPTFVEYLTTSKADLAAGDIKLCCYLKMGMNTKDIAQLFGLSVRAIENKRYRLRKKLDLKKETSLVSFINSID